MHVTPWLGCAIQRRELLIGALGAGLAAACGSTAPILPVTRPDPAVFDACPRRGPRSFSLLTWNVFMMPEAIHESPRNEPRAAAIAATLLEHDFDIVCLQKVFDSSARAVMEGALGARYRYRYGPANSGGSLKLSSGVWVLSRHPLTDYQQIEFSECRNVECLSRKGALLLSGTCGDSPFRLVTTHLQGEEGPAFTPEHQRVRDLQMAEIRDRLIAPHLEAGVPFLVCGDFGTPRVTDDGAHETDEYRRMLATLGTENGPEVRITLDDSRRRNSLARDDTGRQNELDYIFVRKNGCPLSVERARHVFRREGWDDSSARRSDLSYRYAVGARVAFAATRSAEPELVEPGAAEQVLPGGAQ